MLQSELRVCTNNGALFRNRQIVALPQAVIGEWIHRDAALKGSNS
jgi:hypothetical protein